MRGFSLSKDGKYAAYGITRGGSDWLEYVVMETATKKQLPDSLKWVKVSGMAWQGDGFYYSRYPSLKREKSFRQRTRTTASIISVLARRNQKISLYLKTRPRHSVSTWSQPRKTSASQSSSVSDRGTGKDGNALFVLDWEWADGKFLPLIPEITNYSFGVIENVGDKFLVETNHKAPNSRVVLIDPKSPGKAAWKDVMPEKPEPLLNASSAGGKLFATYLKDVVTQSLRLLS